MAAADLFRRAIAAGEEWVYINLGNTYEELEDYERAAEAFQRGADAGDIDAEHNLAVLLCEQGDTATGRRMYRSLIARGYLKASGQEAWFVHEEDGDRARARSMMLQITEDPSETGDIAAGIYGTWLWNDEHDFRAELFLERGVHAEPDAWEPLLQIRQIHARAARVRGATGSRDTDRSVG